MKNIHPEKSRTPPGPLHDIPGPESTNIDLTITIAEIAVKTTSSDQEDVTFVTENKC